MNRKYVVKRKSRVQTWASVILVTGLLFLSFALLSTSAQATLEEGNRARAVDAVVVTWDNVALDGPWTPTGGPGVEGGRVNALAVGYIYDAGQNLQSQSTVYAAVGTPNDGGDTRVYMSVDDGGNWTEVFYPNSDQINALAVSDVYTSSGSTFVYLPRNVYAGSNWGYVYKSMNGGLSWTTVFTGAEPMVYGRNINVLATGPLTSSLVYAAGREWRHDASGVQWGVVYRSQDGGVSWTRALTTPAQSNEGIFNAVAIDPHDPRVAYVAGGENRPGDANLYSVIYQTQDGGDTWSLIYTGTHPWFTSLAIHPVVPDTVYAGSSAWWPGYVLRSQDSGLNWTKVLTGASNHLAFTPSSTVYAVDECNTIFKSTAGGDPGTWTQATSPLRCLSSFVADVSSSVLLYAGTVDMGVSQSTDGADTWWARSNGIQATVQPCDIDVDPQDSDKLFLAAECNGSWMTVNGGQTYSQPSGTSRCMGAFAINPADSNIVYGGAYNNKQGAILRSEDGGLHFSPVYTASFIQPDGSGGDEQIYAVAVAPSMTATVYAAGADYPAGTNGWAVVLRSLDGGVAWTQVLSLAEGSKMQGIAIDPTDANVVYASGHEPFQGPGGGLGFIRRTTDGGTTWTRVFTTTSPPVASMVIDPQKSNVLYAADNNYTVYKSVDMGDHWTVIRLPPWEGGGTSGDRLAIDPYVPSHVYLGGYGYVAESVDGGQTWSEGWGPLNQGTPGMEPSILVVDYGQVTQTLYAGFSGLWYYRRSAPQPGGPMTLTMWTDPAAGPLYANGIDDVFYHALVVDTYQNWVADDTAVTVNYNAGWGVNLDIPKVTEAGHVMGGWRDTATPGVITFTATAADYVTVTNFVTMAFLYNAPASITLEAMPSSVAIGGKTAIVTATLPGVHEGIASDGTPVTFTTSLGTLVPTMTLSARGVATATLTSGEAKGSATVIAMTGSLSETIQVAFTATLYEIYLPLVIRGS